MPPPLRPSKAHQQHQQHRRRRLDAWRAPPPAPSSSSSSFSSSSSSSRCWCSRSTPGLAAAMGGGGSGGGVGCFWLLLASCLVALCAFAFLSPAWIVKERGGGAAARMVVLPNSAAALDGHGGGGGGGQVSFGLLWHCSGAALQRLADCYTFGGLGRFSDIPSGSWQTSAVLCSGGCVLLALSSLLAVVVILLPSGPCERRICTLAGYIQTAAVFIMGFGLLVYPFGLSSATVRRHCENSSVYYAGDCQIGWGYMLAIVGVLLSVFLPFFAKYAPKEPTPPTPIPTIL